MADLIAIHARGYTWRETRFRKRHRHNMKRPPRFESRAQVNEQRKNGQEQRGPGIARIRPVQPSGAPGWRRRGPLGRHLRKLGLEQRPRTGGRRQQWIEIPAIRVNKLTNRRFDLAFANAAGPAPG